jgi:hypothetical protein
MAINEWYNGVVSYFWPEQGQNKEEKEPEENSQMTHLARVKRLRQLLQDSNYKELHREQICMFYSQLIKEYNEARATFSFPKFLYEPDIYTMKVFFTVPLSITTEQIKGVLELFVVFEEDLNSQMPTFFIRNPDYNRSKPNKKCVNFGK